jgi:hypothetical protein
MIVLEDIWTKAGHSSHDHLLPDAKDCFAELVGERFQNLREIKRKIAASNETYYGPEYREYLVRNMSMGGTVRFASGKEITVNL